MHTEGTGKGTGVDLETGSGGTLAENFENKKKRRKQ